MQNLVTSMASAQWSRLVYLKRQLKKNVKYRKASVHLRDLDSCAVGVLDSHHVCPPDRSSSQPLPPREICPNSMLIWFYYLFSFRL
ncbi:hypothetical protein VTO42DRAFT_867 [Malbranchea cinnamomea]